MAQERNAVNGPSETDEIKHEIERTRSEMSETLGEIQDRLRPDHLLQQARDGVTQAAAGKVRNIMSSAGETASTVAYRARGAGRNIADYAVEHPLYIAIAVGAVTWWMLRGRGDSMEWEGAADTSWDDAEAMNYDDSRSLRDRAGEYVSSARDTVSDYASTARETVGEYATSARESARLAAMRARSAASSAAGTANDWATDNPLAAGALALAVGAAVGMSVPRTEWEDTTIGETRDRAMDRASQMAQNLKQNVTEKVTTAAENLVNEVKNTPAASPSEGRA